MSKNIGGQLVSAQEAIRAKSMIFAGQFRAGQRLRQEELAGDAAAVGRLCRCAYTASSRLVSLLRAARADQSDSDPRAA